MNLHNRNCRHHLIHQFRSRKSRSSFPVAGYLRSATDALTICSERITSKSSGFKLKWLKLSNQTQLTVIIAPVVKQSTGPSKTSKLQPNIKIKIVSCTHVTGKLLPRSYQYNLGTMQVKIVRHILTKFRNRRVPSIPI
jgi:cell division protein YceG involved in septum cleavage